MKVNVIYNEDCVNGMRRMDDESVDMVITSPPYEDLRKYKGFSWNFENTAQEIFRVLKKGGVLVWIVADKTRNGSETGTSFRQALKFMEIGLNLHDTMIYQSDKPPLSHNRYEQKFEYMFVFAKGKPKTFNPIMEQCKYAGESKKKRTFRQDSNGEISKTHGEGGVKEKKIKGNIWFYPTGYNKSTKDKIAFRHPAIFPESLVKDHISSWTNEGEIVLDPFMGSGTTGKMCILMNRKYIGFEISEEYCELARERIEMHERENKEIVAHVEG